MSYQKLGFIFSVLLHLLLLALLLYINKTIPQKSKSIALHFELNSILTEGEEDSDTVMEKASGEAPDQADKLQEVKSVVEEELPPEEVTEVAEEEAAPVEKVQEVESVMEEELPPEEVTEVVKEEEAAPVEEVREVRSVMEEEPPPEEVTEVAEEEEVAPVEEVQEVKSVVEEEPPPEEVTEVAEEEAAPVEEVQEVKNVAEEALPEKMAEIVKKVKSDTVYTKSVTKQVVNEKHDELRETSKQKSGSEKVTQSYVNQYIRQHFDYINKSVHLNISYPRRARKMLMEGRVIVSFVVRLDGSIKDIIIKQSSGYSILDKNVIRAVKKAVPFPPPPVEAKVIIPVTYRLGT